MIALVLADLWRRGRLTGGLFPAACRYTNTTRQLLLQALQYPLNGLGNVFQSKSSCLVALTLHEQSITWSVVNVGIPVGEVRNVLH